MKTLNPEVARVLKRLHYPLDVILTCVRWYVAYPLSLRHLEEMMAERGISVDHSTVRRWVLKLLPVLEKAFEVSAKSGQLQLHCSNACGDGAPWALSPAWRYRTFGANSHERYDTSGARY
jgi:hypothetical protein